MNQTMIIAATQLALNRTNLFLEWECVHWLHEHWHILSHETQTAIRRNVEAAYAQDYDDLAQSEWGNIRRIWIGD